MELKRLANRFNFREVEEEWKYEFIIYVFQGMGMPAELLEQYFPESYEDFGISQKKELKKFLNKEGIVIIDDCDGGLKFYMDQVRSENNIEHVLIATWKKCRFNYREDPKEIDPAKKIYVEVVADPWVIFEEEE